MPGTTYGITFSRKLRDDGQYEAAIEAANQAMSKDPEDPEPSYDRGAALYCLGRFEEAVKDLGHAITLDRTACLMDDGVLDDELFEALRKWAENEPTHARLILERYDAILPDGNHHEDVTKWIKHIESAPR